MNMKQVKVSPVYYAMLEELCKKAGKKQENYLADLIAEKYQGKK